MKSKVIIPILFYCITLLLFAERSDLSCVYSDSFIPEIAVDEYDAMSESSLFALVYQDMQGIPVEADDEPFYRLSLNHRDKRAITKMVKYLGEYNWVILLMMKKDLKKIEDKLASTVHPLRFAGYIFSTPYLSHYMKEVKGHRFKWWRFLGKFSENMDEEFKKNNLYQYISGFCHETGVSPQDILYYIDRQDWEGLLNTLI